MPDPFIVSTFHSLLQCFASCFTAPSMKTFEVLILGWVLDLRRHTVTEVVRAAGAVGYKHISSFHRFFSRARWTTDAVGLKLAALIIERLLPCGTIRLVVDDTLGRHTGKCIAAASMHRDPLLSTGRKPFFHWGHVWVVLSIEVTVFDKSWALPVLFRLHRSEKRCKAEGRRYEKLTEQAAELVALLAAEYPSRRLELVGDAAYTNSTLVKGRPHNVTLIGRGRLDAALYAPPPRRTKGQKGRPRVRGKRLRSPEKRAALNNASWKNVTVTVYGKTAVVQVLLVDALWYVVGGGERLRLVIVRDFPGHDNDDVFVCTDTSLSPQHIIESYSKRWSLEVTFREAKGKLGFEDPCNRTERAVERTAPLALVSYSLVMLWYVQHGQQSRAARLPTMPWYTHKASVTFADMLATLRRVSWSRRLSDPASSLRELRKRFRPLVDYVAGAA